LLTDSNADELASSDVLVCRSLAAASRVLSNVGAIVADEGGVLSNPATVARESGIPAVVGTIAATSLIRDGQYVEVDGTSGVVTVLWDGVPEALQGAAFAS
jgi:pyruvate,water dikinase